MKSYGSYYFPIFCIFLQLLESEAQDIEAIETKCLKEFSIVESDYQGDELSKNAKCFLNCVVEELKLIVDGKLVKEQCTSLMNSTIMEDFPTNQLVELMSTCFEKHPKSKDSSKCEVANTLFVCFFKGLEKVFWKLSFEGVD